MDNARVIVAYSYIRLGLYTRTQDGPLAQMKGVGGNLAP